VAAAQFPFSRTDNFVVPQCWRVLFVAVFSAFSYTPVMETFEMEIDLSPSLLVLENGYFIAMSESCFICICIFSLFLHAGCESCDYTKMRHLSSLHAKSRRMD
jgi:hypothetical protein